MTHPADQARFSWARVGSLLWAIGWLAGCGGAQEPIPAGREPVSPEVLQLIARQDLRSDDAGSEGPCSEYVLDPEAEMLLERASKPVGTEAFEGLVQKLELAVQAEEAGGRWCTHATLLGVLGDVWSKREPPTAAAHYAQGLRSAYRAGSPKLVAGLLNDLGLLEGRRQRSSQALEHLAGARMLWRHLGDGSEWANTHLNAGVLNLRMGRLRAARKTLDQACDRLRRLGSSDAGRLAICLTWQGRLLGDTGEDQLALGALEEAMALRRAASMAETPGLDALGGAHLAAGRVEQAAELFERSVSASRNPVDRANATANWADAQLRLGRLHKAIELSRQSEELAEQTGLGDSNLTLHNLHVQAQAFHGLGQWHAMDGAFEWILGTFESLRTRGQGELLLPFFSRRRHVLDHFVLAWASRGRAREAFEVAESVRARSLLDHLVWPMDELRSAADPELTAELDQLRGELGTALEDLEGRLRQVGLGPGATDTAASAAETAQSSINQGLGLGSKADTDTDIELAISRAAALRLRLAAVEAEMRAQIGAEGAEVLDLESAQRLLAPETLMLVYWLGDERSLLWSVERDAFQLYEGLPSKKALEPAITAWRRYMAKGPGAKAGSLRESEALAEALLGPVADRLRPGRPLVLVVEGGLAALPFSALPKPGKQGEPMVKDHPISYAYSVSSVAAIRLRSDQRSTRQGKLISVVADPVYGPNDPRSPRSTLEPSGGPEELRGAGLDPFPLSRLTASGVEAERIAATRGFSPQTGLAATKEWVLGGALADSRFVHFGTHARIDSEAPELSALELSRIDAQGGPIDGSLRLGDLHGLSLSAELVTLAACDSALGHDVVGEGVMALPRGFLKSGAAAVVAGLWSVSDAPTSELMIELYRQLIDLGSAPDQALRAAQLSLLEREPWSDPVHWAGFVLIGDGTAKNPSSPQTFSSHRFLPSSKPMERRTLRR